MKTLFPVTDSKMNKPNYVSKGWLKSEEKSFQMTFKT